MVPHQDSSFLATSPPTATSLLGGLGRCTGNPNPLLFRRAAAEDWGRGGAAPGQLVPGHVAAHGDQPVRGVREVYREP